MSDETQKLDALRRGGVDPKINDMIEQTRAEPYKESHGQLKEWYPSLPSSDEYDFAGAFRDNAIDLEKLREYQTPVQPGEDGEVTPRAMDFLPEDYWRDDGFLPRYRNFDLTTGTMQFDHWLDRVMVTGLRDTARGVVNMLGEEAPSWSPEMAGRTAGIKLRNLITGGDEEVAPQRDLLKIESIYSELESELGLDQYRVNEGNGLAGTFEYMGSEMVEFIGNLAITRRVTPQQLQLVGKKVGMDKALWQRALTRVSNGLKNAASPEVLMAEIMYASNPENYSPSITPEALRNIGFSGPLIDAFENADPETQRTLGNMAEGMLMMEALRYTGLTGKVIGQGAYRKTADFIKGKLEPIRREMAELQAALPMSVTGIPPVIKARQKDPETGKVISNSGEAQ